MKKILSILFLFVTGILQAQPTQYTLAQMYSYWNTTSVPKAPINNNTFYSLANYNWTELGRSVYLTRGKFISTSDTTKSQIDLKHLNVPGYGYFSSDRGTGAQGMFSFSPSAGFLGFNPAGGNSSYFQARNGINDIIADSVLITARDNVFRIDITSKGSGKVLQSDASGNATWVTPASGISGLTTNYIPKAASSTSISNSPFYVSGSDFILPSTSTITNEHSSGAFLGSAGYGLGRSVMYMVSTPSLNKGMVYCDSSTAAIQYNITNPTHFSQVQTNENRVGVRADSIYINSYGAVGGIEVGTTSAKYIVIGNGANPVRVQADTITLSGRVVATTFRFNDGNQGAGKVLTSDAYGLSSWQTPGSYSAGYGMGLTGTTFRVDTSVIASKAYVSLAAGWRLTGNAGTVDGTNFIGTTDNIPFAIKVNNQKAGRIDNTLGNAFYGYLAGRLVNTGAQNVAIGQDAFRTNTSGSYNTAVGQSALYSSTTGWYNCAFGQGAGQNNAISYYNVAVGAKALNENQYNDNTAVGSYALTATNYSRNTAVGDSAGATNVTGGNNTFLGTYADANASNLSNATAIGYSASVTASNKIQLGNASVTDVALGTGSLTTVATAPNVFYDNATGLLKRSTATLSSGTVTSVAQSFTGGLISVAGSPITTSGTLALTVAGTSGGIPYFSSSSTWASSGALTANGLMIGGGAGSAPSTTTTGTGVLTALGVNTGSAGAFVVNGGALGTPSSGTLTSCTGLPISTGVSGLGTGVATFLGTPSSANLASAVTDETGSGALVFGTSPTFITPLLGTPTSGTLTNCTGLPISSGVSGLGTGVATFLATPSSANEAAALTDETGTGADVFANTPTLVTPILGTPTSGTLTNCTGLPIVAGTTGTLSIARGGSNATSFNNNGIVWFDGTSLVNNATSYGNVQAQGWAFGGNSSPLTATATEPFSFSKATNAAWHMILYNGSGGTAEKQGIQLYNGVTSTFLTKIGSVFTTSGINIQSTTLLQDNGPAGLSLAANNATGILRMYAGGATERARIAADGTVGIGTTTTSGALLNVGAGTTTVGSVNLKTGTVKTTAADGDLEYDGTSLFFTNGGAQRQQLAQIQQTRVSTQFDATTNTTLANITGLTATLVAGKSYEFEAKLHLTADAVGGGKFAIAGTATATNIIYEVVETDNTTNLLSITSRQTVLAGSVGQAGTTSGYVKITGLITVNAAGTLTVQFAENASSGTSSILVGSTFIVRQIP